MPPRVDPDDADPAVVLYWCAAMDAVPAPHRARSAGRRRIAALTVVGLLVVGASAPATAGPAGEAGPTTTSSTATTVPNPSTTTTSTSTTTSSTVPPSSSTTAPEAPTTTTAPVGPDEPAPGAPPPDLGAASFADAEARALYEALDGAGDARSGHYDDQPPFDPAAYNAVLDGEVLAARARVATAVAAQGQAGARLAAAEADLADASAAMGSLGGERQGQVEVAARAEEAARRRLVDAYVRHGGATDSLLGARTAGEAAQRVGLLDAVARRDRRAVDEARRSVAGLDDVEVAAAERLARARLGLESARDDVAAADWARLAATSDLTVLEAGSHVVVGGFVFPVAGVVSFVDSFGAPRNTGTPWAHWHEGTDVMAAHGTPLVAVEDGVVARAGTNHLGGNALTLEGRSGHRYYYAHLAGFADGIASGAPVAAGQLVGFVGDTGDARGGAPHVHFEITPPGTDHEVNPYPLLAVAWDARVEALAQLGLDPAAPVAAGLTGVRAPVGTGAALPPTPVGAGGP